MPVSGAPAQPRPRQADGAADQDDKGVQAHEQDHDHGTGGGRHEVGDRQPAHAGRDPDAHGQAHGAREGVGEREFFLLGFV